MPGDSPVVARPMANRPTPNRPPPGLRGRPHGPTGFDRPRSPSSISEPPFDAASITPMAMTARHRPRARREHLPGDDRDHRRDRPLGRGDRRDDPDRADPERRVDEQQATRRWSRRRGPPTPNDSGLTGGSTGNGVRTTAIGSSRSAPTSITPATAGRPATGAGARRRERRGREEQGGQDPGDEGGMLVGRSRRSAGLVRAEAAARSARRSPGIARTAGGRSSPRVRSARSGSGSRAAPQIPRPARKPDAPARRRSAICSMNVSPSAPAPSSTQGVSPQARAAARGMRRRPRPDRRPARSNTGKGSFEQVGTERRQPPDRVEHEAALARRRRPAASRSTSDRRRARRRAAGRRRGRPAPSR